METKEEVMTPRKQALVDAATARALIISYFNTREDPSPATPDQLLQVVTDMGFNMTRLMPLIDRMCASSMLVKHNVEHSEYKYGYSLNSNFVPGTDYVTSSTPSKKIKVSAKNEEVPLNIRINEKEQTLTIRAMGLLITIGKE